MAYGLFLYKEIESKSGKTIRLEIFQNSYAGASAEIEEVGPNPFILTTDNVNNEIYTPIIKTNLLIDIIDTEQLDYSVFFTPDATKFKVILKVEGIPEWSGYLTPDNYTQNESYRSSIQLVARDNLGMLAEFDYDGTALPVKISTLLSAGFVKINFTSTLRYRVKKVDSNDETILNGIVVGRFFQGKTWYDAISEVLKGIGCQLRYVGANNYAVFDIADLKGYGDTITSQDFKFIEQSGVTEIIPAWKSIDVVQDFALQESIYEGAIPTDEFSFLDQRNAGIPRTGIGRPLPPAGLQYDHIVNYYNIPIGARWTSSIPLLEPTFFGKPATSILLTGTEVESLIGVGELSYTRRLPATERGTSLSVKFNCAKLLQGAMAERTLAGELFLTGVKTAGTLHFRCNFFFDDGTTEFYLSSAGWRERPVGYNDYFDIKLEITDPNTNPNVWYQELEFNLGYVESNGTLTMEIYPYWLDNNYLELNVDSYVLELKDFDILFSSANNLIGGVESGTIINSNHNISATIDLPIGQVPFYLGNNLTMIAGIFKNTSYYPPMYNFHRPSGANYKLYELIGREIAHHYKTQRKKLSGNIINSDTFAAMPSFAKPFYDGSKYYALNYGSLDFRSEVMSVELIEVEDYETEDYTFVEATIDTGGSSLGSGDTEFIQWSAAGNAKRIYELDTASEADTAGSFAVIDKLGMSAAKKVPLFTLLDQKENLLPATPSDPEQKFLNGNREWSLINLGSNGNSPRVFFTSIASDVATYKELSYIPEATTSYCSTSITNAEVLCSTFLYPLGVGVESLDAGTWEFEFFAKVSGTAGSLTMKAEVFKRSAAGVETTLFSKYSDVINNTDYKFIPIQYTSVAIPVSSTDRIGVRVYGKNTIAAAITLSWAVGDGDASYFVTPLNMRHAQLRGKNDEAGFQHITEAAQTFSGNKTFSNDVTALELISTRLRIPTGTPSGLTLDKWYLYADATGFSGEVPSGGAITDLYSLTDVALTGVTSSLSAGQMLLTNGTKWANVAASTTNITEGANLYYTNARVKTYADTLYIPITEKGAALGVTPLDSGGKVALQYLPSTLLKYMGVWNASTNTPTLTSPDTDRKGQVWNVSVAGTQFGIAFKLGDWLIYNDSGVAEKSDNSDDVTSVNGFTGAVTLKTSNIAEETNLYYTDLRVKTYADTLYTPLSHASLTNNPHSVTAAQVGALALTGGVLSGGLTINNGRDITLKAPTGSEDSGDLVFLNGNGDELHRLWSGVGTLYYRAAGGTSCQLYHSGNSNLNSVNWTAQELISTRLRIPEGTPSELTENKWYLYADATGFSGEVPSGSVITDMYSLTDTEFSAVMPSAGKMIRSNGTKWVDVTPTTAMITEDTNLYYTNARVQSFADTRYALASSLSNYSPTSHNHSGVYIPVGGLALLSDGLASLNSTVTASNFRTSIFGAPTSGWQIKSWRWDNVPPLLSGKMGNYGTAIVWAGNDTHAFLGVDYHPTYGMNAVIGGGNADLIHWTASLLHSGNYTTYTDSRYYTETEIGNFFGGSVAISGYNRSNWDSAYIYSQIGHLPLSGGTISGGLTLSHGGDLSLKAPVDSSDSGDLVFLDGSGTELHRLWSGSGTLNYRVNGGTTRQLYHSGNLTNTLSSGYLPYWNGSSLVNSAIRQNGIGVDIGEVDGYLTLNVARDAATGFGGTGYKIARFTSTQAAITDRPGVQIGFDTTGGGIIAPATESGITNFLAFWTYSGAWSEKMRLLQNGNVGIGYTDRTEKLAVNGTTYFNGNSQVVGNITMAENINTRLRIPILSGTPSGLTENQYYIYIQQ